MAVALVNMKMAVKQMFIPKKEVEEVVTHPHMFASVQVTIVPGHS